VLDCHAHEVDELTRGPVLVAQDSAHALTSADDRAKLAHLGDNKLVASSLLKSYAGEVNLVYIDPPFDTGRTDFSFRVSVGDESVDKQQSVLEESAYRDTWGRGRESYLSMMYERLVLIHQLLTDDCTLYLHCAPNVSHTLKLVGAAAFDGPVAAEDYPLALLRWAARLGCSTNRPVSGFRSGPSAARVTTRLPHRASRRSVPTAWRSVQQLCGTVALAGHPSSPRCCCSLRSC
jgi:hypothetical protein